MKKAILVTGAGGFIGAHFVSLYYPTENLILLDSFRHKGLYCRLDEILPQNHQIPIVRHDLNCEIDEYTIDKITNLGYNYIDIVNFASHSAVERSISNPGECWTNNCNLILNILNFALKLKERGILGKTIHVSTDELVGDSLEKKKEWSVTKPSNIYSASKAAQEELCYAYWRTYGLPIIVTNCVNNYGYRQDIEKFIPLVIKNILNHRRISIYLDKNKQIGKRYYLHCYDHCYAIKHLLDNYTPDNEELAKFNICSNEEYDNKEVVDIISNYLNIPADVTYIQPSHRKGYDSCYKIDDNKLRQTGWKPKYNFEIDIASIITHSVNNQHWIGRENNI
jgi:dTDP-glucose 4,6-dehydratase